MLWLAASIAVVAALMGNRTAWALLAGLAFSRLHWVASFDMVEWWLVDLMMLAFIIRRNMGLADWMIAWLFLPAWVLYLEPDPIRHDGTLFVVCLQMALCFPIKRLQRIEPEVSHGPLEGHGLGVLSNGA